MPRGIYKHKKQSPLHILHRSIALKGKKKSPFTEEHMKYKIHKRPELCPVCKGEGKYKEKTCHGCDGKGWIEIDESYWDWDNSWKEPYYFPCQN